MSSEEAKTSKMFYKWPVAPLLQLQKGMWRAGGLSKAGNGVVPCNTAAQVDTLCPTLL